MSKVNSVVNIMRGIKWLIRNRNNVYFTQDCVLVMDGTRKGEHSRIGIGYGEFADKSAAICFTPLDESKAYEIGEWIDTSNKTQIFALRYFQSFSVQSLLTAGNKALEMLRGEEHTDER